MPEAKLVASEEGGLGPADEGWFVLNAREARWSTGDLGEYCAFESREARFPQLGINLNRLEPGESMTMYHREKAQEGFLVLSGECLLVVEGEERPLRQWDFVHCPVNMNHVIVGGGDEPCVVLAVGARQHQEGDGWGGYTVDEAAVRHNASAERETKDPKEAYARFPARQITRYQDGWLP